MLYLGNTQFIIIRTIMLAAGDIMGSFCNPLKIDYTLDRIFDG